MKFVRFEYEGKAGFGVLEGDGERMIRVYEGEMFGFPRLRALVAQHGEERPLQEALLEELHSFVGEGWEQEDDITLLTLRRSVASR